MSSDKLTRQQWRTFFAAWAGWALDGMDSFIYALVLVPALSELLKNSGVDSKTQMGFYGGLLFAVFLVGWGCSFIWGPLADRFGRVPILMLTIFCFSIFTLAGAFAQNVWQLGIFRLLAGVGIGGEWSLGGVMVAEDWPEQRRVRGAAYMHTGYYFGTLLAALANSYVGARYGWRAMFLLGGTPALLVAFIRYGIHEPAKWSKATKVSARAAFAQLFAAEFRKRTILNALFVLISMVGLWAGSVYIPTAITQLALREGNNSIEAAKLASRASILLSLGTIPGCLLIPFLVEKFGRRGTLGIFYALMAIFITLSFGWAFYQPHALGLFMVLVFLLGLGGASFCVFTVWLPEQYPTSCRGSGFAFATSFGRFVAAGATFLVGYGITHYGSLGTPVAMTAIPFVAGLFLVRFGHESNSVF